MTAKQHLDGKSHNATGRWLKWAKLRYLPARGKYGIKAWHA